MNSKIYENIKLLCERNKTNINQLEKTLGFGSATIAKWKSTNTASIDKVLKIANHFNVSVDYLLGVSNSEYLIKDPSIITIQRARDKMDEFDKKKMMQLLELTFDKAFGDENDDTV